MINSCATASERINRLLNMWMKLRTSSIVGTVSSPASSRQCNFSNQGASCRERRRAAGC